MDSIKISVTGNLVRVIEKPAKITSGTVGLPVEFTFDSHWANLGKTAVFRAGFVKKLVEIFDSDTTVPWELLEIPGAWLSVGIYGVNDDGSVAIPTIWSNIGVIHPGVALDGDAPTEPPTPEIWQQMSNQIQELTERVDDLGGTGGGGGGSGGGGGGSGGTGADGEDGATFTPNVDRYGNLSWSNDKGLDNPATVNIMGPQGVQGPQGAQGVQGSTGPAGPAGSNGYTPVKGVDYFTAEDKEGIAEEVLEIIPATTAISFDLANCKFTETINGEVVSHSVTFDSEGRPSKIDDIDIAWG